MKKIATVTVGAGGATSIDFTSIPGTYTDLVLILSARSSGIYSAGKVYFNSDTTDANYAGRRLIGDGAAGSSATDTAPYGFVVARSGTTASVFGNTAIYIPNYAGSSAKSFSFDGVEENSASTSYAQIGGLKWTGTAAITSISLRNNIGTDTFVQYSTATLYGITAGSGGATVA
jgi:hypothetical protein